MKANEEALRNLQKVAKELEEGDPNDLTLTSELDVLLGVLFPDLEVAEETFYKEGYFFGKQLIYFRLILDEAQKIGVPDEVLWLLLKHKNNLRKIIEWLCDEATFMTTDSRSVGLNIAKRRKASHCPFCERSCRHAIRQ